MDLNRLEALIGKNNLEKIKNLNILIIGIGGVGGYTLESLVRMGISNITIIDKDIIDSSNLNRQIITNQKNIGNKKVTEAKKRALSINKNIIINDLYIFLNENNINEIELEKYDYVIDTCDTISTKILLINKCLEKNIKIVSSMGAAKRMDVTKIELTTLDKTKYDAIAKKLRRTIDKQKQKKVKVVSSTETAKNIKALGSNSYVPATFGLFITNYIINDTLKETLWYN